MGRPQVVIAVVLSPEGFPLAYEIMPGNTSDKSTLRAFLRKIEAQYGKLNRIWIMDRGIPTEETLALMRASDPPVHYLVGTPKGRLTKLEKSFLTKPWAAVRDQITVKLLDHDGDIFLGNRGRLQGLQHGRRQELALARLSIGRPGNQAGQQRRGGEPVKPWGAK